MDFLTFVSKSEWPLMVGGVAWLFRIEIRKLLKGIRLDEATIAGNNFKFRDALYKAEEISPLLSQVARHQNSSDALQNNTSTGETKAELLTPEQKFIPSIPDEGRQEEVINNWPPDYMIIRAWNEVEVCLYRIAENLEIWPKNRLLGRVPIIDIIRKLQLSNENRTFLLDLRNLRNQAAHGRGEHITQSDALRYRDLASNLIGYLKQVFDALESPLEACSG